MELAQKEKPAIIASFLNKLKQSKQGLVPIALLLCSILFAAGIAAKGIPFLMAVFFLVFAIPAAYAIIVYPKAGIFILLTLAYSISFFSSRLLGFEFPTGTIMDGVLALMLFGLFLKQKYAKDWGIFKNGISAVILVWLFYNLLEVINPIAASRMAWVYTVRTVAVITLTFFLFVYHIRDVKFVRTLFKLWIFFSLIGALYAFKQQYLGFAGFEQRWLASDPSYQLLYFIAGEWRKFSIYTDPTSFSYNMAVSFFGFPFSG